MKLRSQSTKRVSLANCNRHIKILIWNQNVVCMILTFLSASDISIGFWPHSSLLNLPNIISNIVQIELIREDLSGFPQTIKYWFKWLKNTWFGIVGDICGVHGDTYHSFTYLKYHYNSSALFWHVNPRFKVTWWNFEFKLKSSAKMGWQYAKTNSADRRCNFISGNVFSDFIAAKYSTRVHFTKCVKWSANIWSFCKFCGRSKTSVTLLILYTAISKQVALVKVLLHVT